MATKAPGTVWAPLGVQTEPKMTDHAVVCVHTMVGTFNGTRAMFMENGYGGTESHFGLRGDGYMEQWQDLDYEADANYHSNYHVISIETQDIGSYPGGQFPTWSGSNVPPWTAFQIDALVAVIDWLCRHYNIPRSLIVDTCPTRRGLGYHRQGVPAAPGVNWQTGPGAPWLKPGCEAWSGAVGKVCPGDQRINQFKNVIIPRLQAMETDDMPLNEADKTILRNIIRQELYGSETGHTAGLQPIIRNEVKAIVEQELQASGSVTRQQLRELAKLGANDAEADNPPQTPA